MKLIITLILLTITLQATEPIKVYKIPSYNMKVWCFEGTKWLWTGSHNSSPAQIMLANDNHYKTVPKPVPCKEN